MEGFASEEARQKFLARIRAAAAAEDVEARAAQWRGRSAEEHGRALVDLLGLVDAISVGRTEPWPKEPLPTGWWKRRRVDEPT